MTEDLETLKDVVQKLQKAGISYMVTGSIAMSYYATPRMTRDIDFVVELDKTDIQKFSDIFKHAYYVDDEMIQEAVEQKRMFNIIHHKTSMKVDCIIRKKDQYEEIKFSRRKTTDLGGFDGDIISAEDLILSKLLWAKDSMSEVQFRDVKNILSSCPDLDENYLEKWAQTLNVQGLLKNCRSER